jgi:hypothetical protein
MVIHNSGLNLFLYLRETARAIIHTLHRIECLVLNRIQKLGSVHHMMGSSISSILVNTVFYSVDCRVYTVLYILLLKGLRVSGPLWEVYVS